MKRSNFIMNAKIIRVKQKDKSVFLPFFTFINNFFCEHGKVEFSEVRLTSVKTQRIINNTSCTKFVCCFGKNKHKEICERIFIFKFC